MSLMRALAAVTAIWFGAISVIPAAAQDWPTHSLTLVVPWAAGGGTDVMGRIMARRMSEILGQQVIVENVAGGGGMVGSSRVV
jgi:tripartite-type tricarboxylate transporter receptor subunit TctC